MRLSTYGKKEDLTASQKEALSKLERKVVEQGEVLHEQSIRINELESLVKQRENELAHLRKNYELETQGLKDTAAKLQSQSDDQTSKIKSAENKIRYDTDSYRYKEEDLQSKIRGLEKKINDLENEAKKNGEATKALNQELEIRGARVTDLEKRLQDEEAKMASMESMIKEDVNYKPYFVVRKFGSSSIQDIKKTLGLQEGVVRRIVLELEKKGLLRVDGEQVHLA
jgi:chromosome segregation ATPase